MSYNQKKNKDIEYGLSNEGKIRTLINIHYGNDTIWNKNDIYNPIDFINHRHKICFELKSTEQESLVSYRFGMDKYNHYRLNYKKKGYRFIILYSICEYLVYNEIKNIKDYKIIRDYGRNDRGVQEKIKPYIIVERKDFKKHRVQFKGNCLTTPLDFYVEPDFSNFMFDDD